MDYIHRCMTPLGAVTLASDGAALTGLWFDGQKHFGSTLEMNPADAELPVFAEAERWLDIYFSGTCPEFTPELRLKGSCFAVSVWEALLAIPYGQTVTYGEIARRLAARTEVVSVSPRAVGAAVGRNPVSLIVPCHRVIGADGSLTGYAGGLERKKRLLRLEGAIQTD